MKKVEVLIQKACKIMELIVAVFVMLGIILVCLFEGRCGFSGIAGKH